MLRKKSPIEDLLFNLRKKFEHISECADTNGDLAAMMAKEGIELIDFFKRHREKAKEFSAMILIAALFFGCAGTHAKGDMNETAVLLLAPTARVIEAYRDAEQFDYPVADRSLEWHALKVPQTTAWVLWGYFVIEPFMKEPTPEKAAVAVMSLFAGWIAFEMSLRGFRQ